MMKTLQVAAIWIMVLGMTVGTAAAESNGRCVRADVPATMVLPDGTMHEPGSIRICMMRKLSPVTGYHKIHVDNIAHGRFISRFEHSEGLSDDGKPFLQFARTQAGAFILEAYAVPAGNRMLVYTIQQQKSRPSDEWHANHRQADAEPVILLAAASY